MPTTTPFQNLITFSRGSNATVTGPNGLIQWAPSNLLTFSESFNASAWTKAGATVFANQDVAGGTLGSELVTNGDFSNGSTDWITTSWVVSGGVATITNALDSIAQNVSFTAGRLYRVTYTVTAFSGTGGVRPRFFGGTTVTGTTVSAPGTYTEYLYAVTGNTQVAIASTSNTCTVSIDNISVREVTPTAAVAPDGTLTADTLVESATGGTGHWAFQSPATTATAYTFSAYIKASGRTWALLRIRDVSVNDRYAWFNLSTGTVGTVQANLTATIADVGNGWFRCSITVASALAGSNPCVVGAADADNSFTYTGDGTSGILIWGAQLELGSTATTYNPTTVKNLLGFSEAFDNAAWTKIAASVVTGAQANPVNGLFNAQKLMEDTSTGTHIVLPSVFPAVSMGQTYTFSVYAKAAGRTRVYVRDNATSNAGAFFDLSAGAVASTEASVVAASITDAGSGWYRCRVTYVTGATTANAQIRLVSTGTTTSYTGDGSSGVYIYGAQLSDSASLDPYVPTPGAAPSSTAYYGPRFDYDPVTRQPKGILIEEARTNLLLRSEEFDNASWTFVQLAATANAGVAPDGATTADRLTPNAGLVTPYVFQAATTTASAFTVSFYAKADGYNFVQLSDGVSVTDYCNFNLSTGAVGASSGYTGSITNAGNGWYRCAATKTFTAVSTEIRIEPLATDIASRRPNYTANGTSGIYIWGAQLEAGAFATSYIPTIASTVTRSADVATITGSLFSQWYRQDQGAFVFEGSSFGIGSNTPNFLIASNGSAGEYVRMNGASGYTNRFLVQTGGVQSASINVGSGLISGTPTKAASAYAVNSFQAAANAALGTADTSGAIPAGVNQILFGSFFASAGTYLNGHIRSINFIPFRSADFQLETLST